MPTSVNEQQVPTTDGSAINYAGEEGSYYTADGDDRVSELRNRGRFRVVFFPINLNSALFSTTAQYYIDHT